MAKKARAQEERSSCEQGEEGGRYTVLIEEDLAEKIRWIATAKKTSRANWINTALRPIVERIYPDVIGRMGRGAKEE